MTVLLSLFATSAIVIVFLVYLYREDKDRMLNSIALELAFFVWFVSVIGIIFTTILNIITVIIGG